LTKPHFSYSIHQFFQPGILLRISYISLPTAPSPITPNALIIGAAGNGTHITICQSRRHATAFIKANVPPDKMARCLTMVDNSSLPTTTSSGLTKIQGPTAEWIATIIESTHRIRTLPEDTPAIIFADICTAPNGPKQTVFFLLAFLTPDGHPVIYICYSRPEAKRILRTRLHGSLAEQAERLIQIIDTSHLPRRSRAKTIHVGGNAASIIASTLMPR
jgi:hypothetical protein